MILYSCKDVGEDEIDQRVRVLVDESKIPKTDEDFQIYMDLATKAVTDVQIKFMEENGLDLQQYNVQEKMTKVNQGGECRYVG